MTTTITVKAHPVTGKQVRVSQRRGEDNAPDTILQDGQQQDFYAYDDIVISVSEEDATQVVEEDAVVSVGGDGPTKP